jgi:hypothetical protein
MTDVMERLRAANPAPDCPPPPIEDVWRRVDADSPGESSERSTLPAGIRVALSRLGGAAAMAVSVALAVAVAAILVVGHGQTSPQSESRPTAGKTSPQAPPSHARGVKIDPVLASQFSVLSAAPRAADALPAGYRAELDNHRTLSPEPGGARRVTASDGQTAYLVPAKDGACALTSSASTCAPAALLPGAYSMDLCSPTLPVGQIELQWLLPDGATNVTVRLPDGVLALFASRYNVYLTHIKTSTIPNSINWVQKDQHHSVSLGDGGPVGKCMHPNDFPPASKLPKAPPKSVTTTATIMTATGPGVATVKP